MAVLYGPPTMSASGPRSPGCPSARDPIPAARGCRWPRRRPAKRMRARVGDVIISEVQFNPLDLDGAGSLNADSFEFIELYNVTNQAIDLNDWRLSGDNEFTVLEFPAGTRIEAHQALVVVPFRTTSANTANVFRFLYGMQPTEPIVGWYRTKLANNAGQTLRLERPSSRGRLLHLRGRDSLRRAGPVAHRFVGHG